MIKITIFAELATIIFSYLFPAMAFSAAIYESERCDSDGKLCVVERSLEDSSTEFFMHSKAVGVVTASFDIQSNNMLLSKYVSDFNSIIISPKEKKKIASIITEDVTKRSFYNYRFEYFLGVVNALHNDDYIYELPFEPGKSYRITQGYGGKFSHQDEDAYFSYDFQMQEGEAVCAMRDGIVVQLEEKYLRGGISELVRDKANYIMVQHDDNTYTLYSHLLQNGVLVNEGDYISRGQKIALSGNTGYSTMPHLHVSVLRLKDRKNFISLPVKFLVDGKANNSLEVGKFYKK